MLGCEENKGKCLSAAQGADNMEAAMAMTNRLITLSPQNMHTYKTADALKKRRSILMNVCKKKTPTLAFNNGINFSPTEYGLH